VLHSDLKFAGSDSFGENCNILVVFELLVVELLNLVLEEGSLGWVSSNATSFDLAELAELLLDARGVFEETLHAAAGAFFFHALDGGDVDSGLVDHVFLTLDELGHLGVPFRAHPARP
jgi:hypothetical protein